MFDPRLVPGAKARIVLSLLGREGPNIGKIVLIGAFKGNINPYGPTHECTGVGCTITRRQITPGSEINKWSGLKDYTLVEADSADLPLAWLEPLDDEPEEPKAEQKDRELETAE